MNLFQSLPLSTHSSIIQYYFNIRGLFTEAASPILSVGRVRVASIESNSNQALFSYRIRNYSHHRIVTQFYVSFVFALAISLFIFKVSVPSLFSFSTSWSAIAFEHTLAPFLSYVIQCLLWLKHISCTMITGYSALSVFSFVVVYMSYCAVIHYSSVDSPFCPRALDINQNCLRLLRLV